MSVPKFRDTETAAPRSLGCPTCYGPTYDFLAPTQVRPTQNISKIKITAETGYGTGSLETVTEHSVQHRSSWRCQAASAQQPEKHEVMQCNTFETCLELRGLWNQVFSAAWLMDLLETVAGRSDYDPCPYILNPDLLFLGSDRCLQAGGVI